MGLAPDVKFSCGKAQLYFTFDFGYLINATFFKGNRRGGAALRTPRPLERATTLGGSILFTENCGHGLPALAETSIQWLGTSKIGLIPVRGMSGMVPGMVPNEIQSK